MTRRIRTEDSVDLLAYGWHGVRRASAFDGDTGATDVDAEAAGMRSATWSDLDVDRTRARRRAGARPTR